MHRVEEIGMFIDDKGGCRVDKDGSGLQQVNYFAPVREKLLDPTFCMEHFRHNSH